MDQKTFTALKTKLSKMSKTQIHEVMEKLRAKREYIREDSPHAEKGIKPDSPIGKSYEKLTGAMRAAREAADKTPYKEVGREDMKTKALITGVRGGTYYLSKSTGEKVYIK